MSAAVQARGALVARDDAWHGPASVAGSVVGSLVTVVMVLLLSDLPDAAHHLLPWTLGLPLLPVGGVVRRFGVGLVASVLVLPMLPLAITAAGLALG